MLKKFNAVMTLIAIAATAIHMVATTVESIKGVFEEPPVPIMIALYGSLCLHAAISMIILFFNKSESGKIYAAHNKQTVEQRISAVILIPLIFFHYAIYSGDGIMHELLINKSVIVFILLVLLDICFTAHVASSLERALTTLGINSKALNIIGHIIMLIPFLLSIAGGVKLFFIG